MSALVGVFVGTADMSAASSGEGDESLLAEAAALGATGLGCASGAHMDEWVRTQHRYLPSHPTPHPTPHTPHPTPHTPLHTFCVCQCPNLLTHLAFERVLSPL